MKIIVKFNCDNAAFDGDDQIDECEAVLRRAINALSEGQLSGRNDVNRLKKGVVVALQDSNGNTIGVIQVL